MSREMHGWAIHRILTNLLNHVRRNQTAVVPSKISQMELAAYDAVAYDVESINSAGEVSTEEAMDRKILENTMMLSRPAFIAGDCINGTVNIRSASQTDFATLKITLVGEGKVYYHNTYYRKQNLCEIQSPPISMKEYCTESGKAWSIPFSVKSDENLSSSFDGEKKGEVRYFLSWEIHGNAGSISHQQQEVVILANHCLDSLPRSHEISGNNVEEEEHDNMRLQLYSPASAYLPGEQIQFRAFIQNKGKKMIKKVAVFLIQNALFFKSRRNTDVKGRNRSFLMNVKEKLVQLKEEEQIDWTDEIQIPDPIAPSASGFHKIHYELVLVAITKGKKSNTRDIFNEVRYHFDMETYQDDYFRDYLPHTSCDLQIGSHHGNKLSACMSSSDLPVRAINDIWKQSSSQQPKAKISMNRLHKSSTCPITLDTAN